ncbi:hypothetical protein EBR96_05330, partial [bacterium]|nr:hypothetical protein [bacterium]
MFLGKFIGDGSEITGINSNAISGAISTAKGGTGLSNIPTYSILYYDPVAKAMAPIVLKPGQVISVGGSGKPTGSYLAGNSSIRVSTESGSLSISHGLTSSQPSFALDEGNVIQSVFLDDYGHVTGLAATNLDDRYQPKTEADSRYIKQTGGTLGGTFFFNRDTRLVSTLNSNLIIEPTGSAKVGIGTSAPTQRLDVAGAIRIGNTPTGSIGTIRYNPDSGRFEGYNGAGQWVALDVQSSTAGGWTADSGTVYALNNTYKVGIGTYLPTEMLDVVGKATISGGIRTSGDIAIQTGKRIIFGTGSVGDGVLGGSWQVTGSSLSAPKLLAGASASGSETLVVSGSAAISGAATIGSLGIGSSGLLTGSWQFASPIIANRIDSPVLLQLSPSSPV